MEMIKDSIEEHISAAKNESIWCLGSDTAEETIYHEINSKKHMIIANSLEESLDEEGLKSENVIKIGDKFCKVFEIKITETLERIVPFIASYKEEAMEGVIEKYEKGEIVLGAEDYTVTEFEYEV